MLHWHHWVSSTTHQVYVINKYICWFISSSHFKKIFNQLLTLTKNLPIKSDELTEENVESASVATALAKYDLPEPGGWNIKMKITVVENNKLHPYLL